MKPNNCFYYTDRPQHVYNTLKRFPEVAVSRKDAAINETNKASMKANITRNLDKENKRSSKKVEQLIEPRVNSQKIFMEDHKLQSLCKSEDVNCMREVKKAILSRKIDERKNRLNHQLSYLKSAPLVEANLVKISGNDGRPQSSTPTSHSVQAKQRNKDPATAMDNNAGVDDMLTSYPLMTGVMLASDSPAPNNSSRGPIDRSPFKPAAISSADLEAVCFKLQQMGFHFYPGSDAVTGLRECGLLTVLNAGESRTNWYVARANEMNKLDLQSRLLLVLGVKLSNGELNSLHSLLLKS